MEAFNLEDDNQSNPEPTSPNADQLFLALSSAAVTGQSAVKTLCMEGDIPGHPVSILVDSGSSHTFISRHLSQHLSGVQPTVSQLSVKVANGTVLACATHIPNAL